MPKGGRKGGGGRKPPSPHGNKSHRIGSGQKSNTTNPPGKDSPKRGK